MAVCTGKQTTKQKTFGGIVKNRQQKMYQTELVNHYAEKVEKAFRNTSKNIVKYQNGQARQLANKMQIPFWVALSMLKARTAKFLQ